MNPKNFPTTRLLLAGAAALGLALASTSAHADTLFPIVVTSGFNAQPIANGSGSAASSTNGTLDSAYNFYDASYASSHSDTGGSGAFPAGEVAGFDLAPVTGNDDLLLSENTALTGGSTSGTLTFSPVTGATSLEVLATGANGGGTVGYTLNFVGGTATGTITVPDWYEGSDPVISGLGRVTNAADDYDSVHGDNFDVYGEIIAIPTLDQGSTLTSIDFTFDSGTTNSTANIFAVSAVVPEPSTWASLFIGAGALVFFARSRKRRA